VRFKKPAEKYIGIQGGMKLRKPSILVVNLDSSYVSFLFLSASIATTYIFTALNCTITIISLDSCALNAEFHHFILRFNKNIFTLWIPLKKGIGDEKRPKDRMKTGFYG
jgi:hypothetical protein